MNLCFAPPKPMIPFGAVPKKSKQNVKRCCSFPSSLLDAFWAPLGPLVATLGLYLAPLGQSRDTSKSIAVQSVYQVK